MSNVRSMAAEPPQAWAERNFGNLDLGGDERLSRRAARMAAAFAANPSGSIPVQFEDFHQAKAAYRFLDHPAVTAESVTATHRRATLEEARARPLVLMVQDTSEISYGKRGSREGLGAIGHGDATDGLLMHTTLAIDPAARGEALGIAQQRIWAREARRAKETQAARRARAGRESLKWDEAIRAVGGPPEGVRWVHVADREADVWETFVACMQTGSDALVRACGSAARRKAFRGHDAQADPQAREQAEDLIELARAMPACAGCTLERRGGEGRPARRLRLHVSFDAVTLLPPRLLPRGTPPLRLWLVRVWEDPKDAGGEEPVEWILLTTVPVRDASDALRMAEWYRQRWTVEEYHKCLKTGCRVEKRQLEHGLRLAPLVAMLAVTALRLLNIRGMAKVRPDAPATDTAPPMHVEVLSRLRGIPREELTCRRFWREVARLGGFLARKSDGEPGWQTLWLGWTKLDAMASGANLFGQRDACG